MRTTSIHGPQVQLSRSSSRIGRPAAVRPHAQTHALEHIQKPTQGRRAARGATAACRGIRRRALRRRLAQHAPLSAREEPLRQRSAPRGSLVVVVAAGAAAAVEAAAVAELLEEEAQELARLDSCPPRKGGPREGTQIRARPARCMTAEPAECASGPPLGASAVPWSVRARKPRARVVTATLWDASYQCAAIRGCKLRSAEERK